MKFVNTEQIYSYTDKKTNRFNMYCLLVINLLAILTIILNDIGVFSQDKSLIRFTMIELIIANTIPYATYLIHDKIRNEKQSILELSFFRKMIIVISYYTIINLSVVLSFHAVLLMVIPLLIVTQYKNSQRTFVLLLILTLLLVPFVTYGSFFFGIYDANLLKPLAEEEAVDLKNRVDILKNNPIRIIEIFTHYALPRMLCIAAIDYIAFVITRRRIEMINLQVELNNKVNEEIINKSNMQKSIIDDLADVIESRDIETGEHIKRTKKYVSILIDEMKKDDKYKELLSETYCENIINAAPLHDIGKIAVSDVVLCKPGKLTDEEFDKMKLHTTAGGEIINRILNDLGDDEFLKVAYQIAMFHHEKWNGKGYPSNLKENDIPLPARIMAIADVFDALVAERVYKKPIPVVDAINIIIGDSSTHFDPNLIEIFKKCSDKFVYVSKEKIE